MYGFISGFLILLHGPILLFLWGWSHLGGSVTKESVYDAGDSGLILGLGRCPGEGNGNPPHGQRTRNLVGYSPWGTRVGQVLATKPPPHLPCISFPVQPWEFRDCGPSGSSVHGVLQARILEWVAIPFSRGSSPPQGSNPGLLQYRQMLYHLSHQGSPFPRPDDCICWSPSFISPKTDGGNATCKLESG